MKLLCRIFGHWWSWEQEGEHIVITYASPPDHAVCGNCGLVYKDFKQKENQDEIHMH